jgi:hypothetical protein
VRHCFNSRIFCIRHADSEGSTFRTVAWDRQQRCSPPHFRTSEFATPRESSSAANDDLSCPYVTNVGATKVYPGRNVFEPESAVVDPLDIHIRGHFLQAEVSATFSFSPIIKQTLCSRFFRITARRILTTRVTASLA